MPQKKKKKKSTKSTTEYRIPTDYKTNPNYVEREPDVKIEAKPKKEKKSQTKGEEGSSETSKRDSGILNHDKPKRKEKYVFSDE